MDNHYPQNNVHQVPRNFKAMTSRAQKLFRKVLDPEPEKRLQVQQNTPLNLWEFLDNPRKGT